VNRKTQRQARLARVTLEDQALAIAGAMLHGSRFGVHPDWMPDQTRREVYRMVLRAREAEERDLLAVERLVREEIETRRLDGGIDVLAEAVGLAELEAPMRPHELERNSRHLADAFEFARLTRDLEHARANAEHRLEAALAEKLAALEEGEREPQGSRLVVVRASELEEKPVEWLWTGYILAGAVNLFVSAPKLGKSTVTAMMAATVSKGAAWPSGPHLPSQEFARADLGDVVMVCYEDDLERTVVPRLKAAGADMDRIHFVRGIERPSGRSEKAASLQPVDLAKHFDAIAELVQRTGAKLLVVDPVMSGFAANRDTNADNEVRAVLGPFVTLAEQTRVSVVFVTHTNKRGEGTALDSAIGSRAFSGVARAVVGLEKIVGQPASADQSPSNRRVLAPIGINLGKPRKGLVFEIRSEEGNEARSYVEWLEEFDGDMDDFRRDQAQKQRAARNTGSEGKLAECKAALLEILNREKWLPSKTLDEELHLRCGHSKTTIQRARNELRDAKRIGIERFGAGSSHKWFTGIFGTDPRGSTHVRAEWISQLEVARRPRYSDRD
jgi:putative DNA primase/helicase